MSFILRNSFVATRNFTRSLSIQRFSAIDLLEDVKRRVNEVRFFFLNLSSIIIYYYYLFSFFFLYIIFYFII